MLNLDFSNYKGVTWLRDWWKVVKGHFEQVQSAVNANATAIENTNTALSNHRTASEIDHPNGSVTTQKIAPGAVTEGKIGTGAVTAPKIGSGAVTNEKIGTGAVSADKLGTDAVTTVKVKNKNITTDKIADGAVGMEQLSSDVREIVTNDYVPYPKRRHLIGNKAAISIKQSDGTMRTVDDVAENDIIEFTATEDCSTISFRMFCSTPPFPNVVIEYPIKAGHTYLALVTKAPAKGVDGAAIVVCDNGIFVDFVNNADYNPLIRNDVFGDTAYYTASLAYHYDSAEHQFETNTVNIIEDTNYDGFMLTLTTNGVSNVIDSSDLPAGWTVDWTLNIGDTETARNVYLFFDVKSKHVWFEDNVSASLETAFRIGTCGGWGDDYWIELSEPTEQTVSQTVMYTLNDLPTNDKSSILAAVKELSNNIGTLSEMLDTLNGE